MTHMVGSGGANHNEQLFFNGALVATDPFQTTSPSWDRSWSTFTSSVSMTGTTTADGHGETANTTVAYSKTARGDDCLAWGGIVFSTPVLDADSDGLPDALEASSTAGAPPWMNPDGELLPDLHGRGRRRRRHFGSGVRRHRPHAVRISGLRRYSRLEVRVRKVQERADHR